MPFIYSQTAQKIILLGSFSVLLSACSSPLKYEPREYSSSANNQSISPNTGSCRSPYVVSSGDTLSGISRECGVNMQAIAKLNDLLPPYIIYVKQELILPIKQNEDYKKSEARSSQNKVTTQKTATNTSARNIEQKNTANKAVANTSTNRASTTASKKVVNTSKTSRQVTAKAIDRSDKKKTSTKSRAWQWPMHKGLSYKYLRDHAGLSVLEIYGVPGQKVKAVAPGKVVYAGNGIINYGWMLVIKHDNDYMSIYAHNSALLVKEGETVKAGETVATMGATGNTKVPKLYLEARYQGRKIDIKKILKP